ncbi:MAG: glycosyltransferase, partial [Planctomycetales bacterium]|nr:glycosyltransferase [Planctomycetales bacterium]
PHIVHAHTPKAGLVGMLAATRCQVPVRIYHLHGLRFETTRGLRRTVLQCAERLACQLAHRVLSVSQSVRDRAVAEHLVSAPKTRVLANGSINGIDLTKLDATLRMPGYRNQVRDRLGIPADARCVGFVGRLVRDKGIIELSHAWQWLRARYPDLHLLLVGPFEELDPVPDSIRTELQADPRVHLTGLDWNVLPYYGAMDLFTLPTYREGLPTVLLEAAAMQVPVVATRVTGCVDAVPPESIDALVPAGDSEALAKAIARYLDSPQRRAADAQAGRAWVAKHFRPAHIWGETYREYLQLLPQAVQAMGLA